MADLPIELIKAREEIERYARGYHLDFFTTIFEVLAFDELNQVASYGGFPTRYPHWSFGMEYEQLSKGYEYGLSKIYEMVINNDPCYAYLLKSNPIVDQKLVMAHVYGHCDFFKNNYWFSKTNRRMIDQIANHSTRIRRYIDRHGFDQVETFIDMCLSIDSLIDRHAPFIARKSSAVRKKVTYEAEEELGRQPVPKLPSKDYMDSYINPPKFLDEQRKKMEQRHEGLQKFPPDPAQDVMQFLIEYAPMKNWQRDILSMIRDEAYYFSPQAQTKIMNEGWASYWHSKIMTQKALRGSELIDYADHHSGTLASSSGRLNPYKIGIELFRDIEERWDKGKFGKDYEQCENLFEKKKWDRKLGQGRAKIFEVRRIYNDVMFIDEFLTEEFCYKHKLFSFSFNPKSSNYEILSREFSKVKRALLFGLTNMGQPTIQVEDANFDNRGELLLKHRYEGIDLRIDWARETIRNIQGIWTRPVNLLTIVEGKGKLLTYDGKEHRERSIDLDATPNNM